MLLVVAVVALRLLTDGSAFFLYVFCISSSPCLCSLALFLLLFLTMMVLLLIVVTYFLVSTKKIRKYKKYK
jgi:hypothetical protein